MTTLSATSLKRTAEEARFDDSRGEQHICRLLVRVQNLDTCKEKANNQIEALTRAIDCEKGHRHDMKLELASTIEEQVEKKVSEGLEAVKRDLQSKDQNQTKATERLEQKFAKYRQAVKGQNKHLRNNQKKLQYVIQQLRNKQQKLQDENEKLREKHENLCRESEKACFEIDQSAREAVSALQTKHEYLYSESEKACFEIDQTAREGISALQTVVEDLKESNAKMYNRQAGLASHIKLSLYNAPVNPVTLATKLRRENRLHRILLRGIKSGEQSMNTRPIQQSVAASRPSRTSALLQHPSSTGSAAATTTTATTAIEDSMEIEHTTAPEVDETMEDRSANRSSGSSNPAEPSMPSSSVFSTTKPHFPTGLSSPASNSRNDVMTTLPPKTQTNPFSRVPQAAPISAPAGPLGTAASQKSLFSPLSSAGRRPVPTTPNATLPPTPESSHVSNFRDVPSRAPTAPSSVWDTPRRSKDILFGDSQLDPERGFKLDDMAQDPDSAMTDPSNSALKAAEDVESPARESASSPEPLDHRWGQEATSSTSSKRYESRGAYYARSAVSSRNRNHPQAYQMQPRESRKTDELNKAFDAINNAPGKSQTSATEDRYAENRATNNYARETRRTRNSNAPPRRSSNMSAIQEEALHHRPQHSRQSRGSASYRGQLNGSQPQSSTVRSIEQRHSTSRGENSKFGRSKGKGKAQLPNSYDADTEHDYGASKYGSMSETRVPMSAEMRRLTAPHMYGDQHRGTRYHNRHDD